MVGPGDPENLTRKSKQVRRPEKKFLEYYFFAAPRGESVADVSVRVARARRRILSEHAGRTVLLVSHVTPIKLMLAAALGAGDEVVHRVFLEAASLCSVAWSSDGRASVRLVNDTAHLR